MSGIMQAEQNVRALALTLLLIAWILRILLASARVEKRGRALQRCADGLLVALGLALLALICTQWPLQHVPKAAAWIRNVPVAAYFVLAFALMLETALELIWERRRGANMATRDSIREAMDNLPSGICFFNAKGMPVLLNRTMLKLCFAMAGRELQSLPELGEALAAPKGGAQKLRKETVLFPDGSVWQFSETTVKGGHGSSYTEVLAADVTELYQRNWELAADNQRLREVGAHIRHLAANVTKMTSEEELLNTKMRVHDEMGRSLLATRRLLVSDTPLDDLDTIMTAWRGALGLLKRDNAPDTEADAFTELKKAALDMGIQLELSGTLPEDDSTAYILIVAMRECVTNAVRHAGAKKLVVAVEYRDGQARMQIKNDGVAPAGTVVEGGGLSALRRRIERAGGRMTVQSAPVFMLCVTVPVEEEADQ